MEVDEDGNLTIAGEMLSLTSDVSPLRSLTSEVLPSIFDSILAWLSDKVVRAREFVADVLKPVLVAVIIAGIFWFRSVRVEGCKGKRVEEKELTSHTPIHPYTLTPTNP